MSTDQVTSVFFINIQRNRFRKSGRKVHSSWKIDQLYHARWLILAIRLVAVYIREESSSGNLIKLVHYILKVYAPSWFEKKSTSKPHESRRILFQNLSRIDQLSLDDVKTIAKQNLRGNFFCLPPENFLYALIKDEIPSSETWDCKQS